MYLVDTNIFLEGLLEREKAIEVRKFFQNIDLEKIFTTDLSLHSIGIILFKLKKFDVFNTFLDDIIENTHIIRLSSDDMKKISSIASKFNIDFDDAYQYIAAEKFNLTIISFDKDFDKTERGRKTPSEIIKNG